MPTAVWGWRSTLVVTCYATVFLGLIAWPTPGDSSQVARSQLASLAAPPLVLVGAAFVSAHGRLTDNEISGRLAAGLSVLGISGLAAGAAISGQPGRLASATPWLIALSVVVTVALCALVMVASTGRPIVDPMTLGVRPGDHLLTRRSLPSWFAVRVAMGVCLLAVGRQAPAMWPSGATLPLVMTTAGAVLVLSACLALLRSGIDEATRALGEAGDRAVRAEARHDVDRARMHEIGSAFAGIAAATRLIGSARVALPQHQRTSLEQLLSAETARLERLLDGRRGVLLDVDLDRILHRQVLSHQTRGHVVTWTPTGAWVVGDPDAVAAIVDVLLDNAATHGIGVARVSGTVRDGIAEVAVTDEGPGVAADLTGGRLFDLGHRGEHSPGQGIGLHLARGLAERQGGYLVLRTTGTTTTFVLGLPAADGGMKATGENDEAVVGTGSS